MPKTQLKEGSYTISAKSTEVFTFWWPWSGIMIHKDKASYFDVSIEPDFDGEHQVITPLVEVKRERTFFFGEENDPTTFNNKMLYMTLQNDNDFPVTFYAVHIHIE